MQKKHKSRSFPPLNRWPADVFHQVMRFAALPDFVNGQSPYETALALTRVSSDVRRAAMPGFLHTVVISNPRQLYAFLEAVRRSRSQRQPRRLDIHCDYAQMVRRFWCTDGPHRLLSDPTVLDYATLYEVIRNVDSLGMTFVTLPMLTDCFAEGRNIQKEWKCRSLVLVGPGDRWNPLVNSPEGVVFLSKLTHLVVYNLDGASDETPYPPAVARIPFAAMPSLTHFAFPMLAQARGGIFPMAAIVSADRQALRQFVNAPANYSSPSYIRPPQWDRRGIDWEAAFGVAEPEQIWGRAIPEDERKKQLVKRRK
ncbi:hypothetical protein BDN71DRAFT_484491 [Pleurotus eryngii]|uniref:Uncharacterized protein n=1 Tax=Pleurotus eryngii TaxID=5323 RepID=A0A9P6A9L4_PLEER|nr:hypothetical protein BDN71DRAFT_484491 [Pleurotus eryngii]